MSRRATDSLADYLNGAVLPPMPLAVDAPEMPFGPKNKAHKNHLRLTRQPETRKLNQIATLGEYYDHCGEPGFTARVWASELFRTVCVCVCVWVVADRGLLWF